MLHRATIAACAALILSAGTSDGALTSEQFKCQKTVAKQGRVFFKKRFKFLSKCENSINSGKFPTTTDCTVEPTTLKKLDKAEDKLRDKVTGTCPDMVVAGLDFGGLCFGVVAGTALAECQVQEHEAASDSLLATVYGDPDPVSTCLGGPNDGRLCTQDTDCAAMGGNCVPYESDRLCAGGANNANPCSDTADCPDGACVLDDAQQDCTATLAKALGKLADKRQKTAQTCKKKVAKDKLPATTDCIALGQAKLDKEFGKTVDKIRGDCPALVTPTLAYGNVCTVQTDTDSVAACGTCSANKTADTLTLVQHGSSARGGTALAKQVTDVADCVGGRQSRCRVNDYLIRNDRIRVVIQDLQRDLFGIGQFGGQIIDGDIVRTVGPDRDNFEEWALALNIESTAHYTSITVLNDGNNGGPAVIRATGVDDLLDFINPSSTIASFNIFTLPAAVDDHDIPVTVTTDYILEPGTNYVRVETTVQNEDTIDPLSIFFGEYINGSGEVEMFQSGYGFGEPLATGRCPITPINLCNYTAYMGTGAGDGVSYGYIQQTLGSSTFTTSGVHVPQLGAEVVLALIGAQGPPFTMQPTGNPGDSLTFTRYFVVGDGEVSDVSDARNEIQCLPTGTLQGTVTAGGNPAVRADIAVLGATADGPGLGALTCPAPLGPGSCNVITHTRTDDQGKYSLTVPPGSYTVVANLDGSPYEGGGSTPMMHPVTVAAFGTETVDAALPATGALQVTVEDENSQAVAAKASVVGFDPSAEPFVKQNIAGLIGNTTAMFGDRTRNGNAFGVAKTIFIGPSGDSGVVPIEPSDYQVVVSRGPEYSIDAQDHTVIANATESVMAKVERVIDSTGFVAADFHVHSIDSPDSRVPNVDRVISMLDEGMDFFTPTDHDIRFDYQPVIDALGATNLLGTAVGEEITSFDYGHWNAWPLITDPNRVSNGSVDFGGAAPAGQDYPSAGFYNETPATVMSLAHADAPGASNTAQVNHIHSHFGLDGGSGLAIDTALTPPESTVPAAARRLNPAIMNFFTDTFDALEIWIGDTRGQISTNFLGQNAGDWLNLLNQGIVRTGVADSDTHTTAAGVSGFPRTMVASPSDDPGDLSGLADTLSTNVNAGRAFGTDGPMVRVSAFAASTGQTADLEHGGTNTIETTDGEVDITVDIQSPTWVEFDRVEFYINTTTTRVVKMNQETGAGLINVNRYTITPDVVQTAPGDFTVTSVPVAGTSSSRLEATATLALAGLTEDIYVVVMVKGTDGVSKPLFPVLPNDLKRCTTVAQNCAVPDFNTTLASLTDGNLGELGITALAFTNPLFIDADGIGGWSPPGVQLSNP
jgi:hypothetical protein